MVRRHHRVVAVGAVIGFLLPLPAFAIFSLVTLVAYAVFANGFSGFAPMM
jgi:hypothetical protein